MKYIALTLLVCALASTGFAKPVENVQLPPIGGFLNPVHPVILNLAKETLAKVQENLHAAGRVEDAVHLNQFIEETERILKKGQEGDVHASEAHEFDEHLEAIYEALEHYKEYLPVDKNLLLVVPTREELAEHLNMQLKELIEKLEEKKEYAKVKLLKFYQKVLNYFAYKKGKYYAKKEKFERTVQAIIEVIRAFGEQIRDRFTTVAPFDQEDDTLLSAYSSDDLMRSLLDSLVFDLDIIEKGLKEDGKYVEYGRIKLYKNIVKAIASNTHGGNANRKSVQYALDRGIELIKKYAKYFNKKSSPFLMSGFADDEDDLSPEDLDRDDEEVEEDVIEEQQTEEEAKENLSILQRIRKQLSELRDRQRSLRHRIRVRIIEAYIRVIDSLIERLKARRLDNTRFHDYVKRARDLLERFAEHSRDTFLDGFSAEDDLEEVDDHVDESDLPSKEKENLSVLQTIRERLYELRERKKSRRQNIRVRIIDSYIRVVDVLMNRLKERRLDNTRFEDFVKRAQDLLERFAERDTFLDGFSDEDDEKDLKEIDEKLIEGEQLEEKEDQPEPEDLDNEAEVEKNEEEEEVDEHYPGVVDADDLNTEEKESLTRLEAMKEKLIELRNKLRSKRLSIRARIVDAYIKAVNNMSERVRRHRMKGSILNRLEKRVTNLVGALAILTKGIPF